MKNIIIFVLFATGVTSCINDEVVNACYLYRDVVCNKNIECGNATDTTYCREHECLNCEDAIEFDNVSFESCLQEFEETECISPRGYVVPEVCINLFVF